jgi:hypothetical protein
MTDERQSKSPADLLSETEEWLLFLGRTSRDPQGMATAKACIRHMRELHDRVTSLLAASPAAGDASQVGSLLPWHDMGDLAVRLNPMGDAGYEVRLSAAGWLAYSIASDLSATTQERCSVQTHATKADAMVEADAHARSRGWRLEGR